MKRLLWGLLGVFVAALWLQAGLAQASTPKPGAYLPYSAEAFAEAYNQQRVLFFFAGWCPDCRAFDRDITARAGEIPPGVVIFKVDFDTETALRTKHGVVRQHTFVLVDAEGNALQKWSGGGLAEIIAKVTPKPAAQ